MTIDYPYSSVHKIIHIDMDAFFASVEQRDHPEWRGKPLIVGSASDRGVVAAASYEARKFGVFSALSSHIALLRCPQLIVAPPRIDVYSSVSNQIKAIFLEYTDLVEPLSLDEAYLDVTENHLQISSATLIAKEIKQRIYEQTGLTASAGVSYNKFLAKLASDMNKPNGLTLILPGQAQALLDNMDIERFYGVGRVTAQKMHYYNIHTGKDLRLAPVDMLKRLFGKQGIYFHEIAHGRDNREVEAEKVRKSIGVERTFEHDLTTPFQRVAELYSIELELMERIQEAVFFGKTLTLKVKYHNFEQITRSRTIDGRFEHFGTLHKHAKQLLSELSLERTSIRLLGLSVSKVGDDKECHYQLTLDF